MPYLRQLNDQRGTLKPLPKARGWKQRGMELDTVSVLSVSRQMSGYRAGQRSAQPPRR